MAKRAQERVHWCKKNCVLFYLIIDLREGNQPQFELLSKIFNLMRYNMPPPASLFMTYKERYNLSIIYAWIVNRWIVNYHNPNAKLAWNWLRVTFTNPIKVLHTGPFYGIVNLVESCILKYMIMNFLRQSLHYLSSNI